MPPPTLQLPRVQWSVLIPALDEAGRVGPLAERLRDLGAADVVVADGGSTDDTAVEAAAAGARVVTTAAGRGRQIAAAAAAATGTAFWILHADATVHTAPWAAMEAVLARGNAGAFRLRIEHADVRLRLIEVGTAVRCGLTGIPYGDQGMFLSRTLWEAIGGTPDWPLMEDIELARRIRAVGRRVELLPFELGADARRWLADGPFRRTARNWGLAVRFQLLGADPHELARRYPPAPLP